MKLHLKSPGNWINDPNGFIYYKGKYHLFYQYFPYAPVWGTMHWGHAVSDDLISWEHKGIALFPSKYYDRNGVFSGSAIEKDGKLYLYYSAVRYLDQDPENIHLALDWSFETSQALLISEDGETFDNWNMKKQIIPVIRDASIADSKDTRDPKVWLEDGRYFMILGSNIDGKMGKIIIYDSDDGENFRYLSGYSSPQCGTIMECPDLFEVDGSRIFVGSPIGVQNDGKEYANQSVCTFASFDSKKGELKLADDFCPIDYGGDLYAPQTNVDEAGRRVLIGWMRMPQPVTGDDGKPWIGMMSLPRVVNVRDGHICFSVHPHVDRCFTANVTADEASKSDEPMRIKAELSEGDCLTVGGFEIRLEDGCVVTDRSKVFPDAVRYHVVSKTPRLCGGAAVDVFVTDNLVEVFVNDGEYVISNIVYKMGRQIEGKYDSIQLFSGKTAK